MMLNSGYSANAASSPWLADWTGNGIDVGYSLWDTCSSPGTYPAQTYWSCNNTHGLHLNGGNSNQARWDFSASNENMEVYVK